MLALIAAAYATIELRELWPKGTPVREGLKSLHFTIGLTVLVLVVARIAARIASGPAPAIRPEPSPLQHKLSAAVHGLLYLFMIAMASGKPVTFLGLALPSLVAESKALAKSVKEVHEIVGNTGYFVIGLHALAALAHHYGTRDNTLLRMLPGRS
jgi:cytochrome b561